MSVLSALCYSYSFADTVTGRTNNAAVGGLSWNMDSVLPSQAGLLVNGMFYQYTINKNVEAPAQVSIRNKLRFGEGYIFENTDDWSGLPGNTITKLLGFASTPKELWGDGEIAVLGEASITNPTVAYNFEYDSCYIILSNPACPGYAEALYQWLLDKGLLVGEVDINDPYYEEYVNVLLEQQIETELITFAAIEESQDVRLEVRMTSGAAIAKLADVAQQEAVLTALQATLPNFESYYKTMPGGFYAEKVSLEDAKIYDNTSVLRNLAQQSLHRDLVQLQYK